MIYETMNPDETYELAYKLGKEAKEGLIVALTGDLGVGKTVFAKGFAKGLGITEPIVSPTYTIMYVYESGRIPMYHFDLYRLGDVDELYEIGFEEYAYGKGVSLIEWADLFREDIQGATWVTIEKDLSRGMDYRRITVD